MPGQVLLLRLQQYRMLRPGRRCLDIDGLPTNIDRAPTQTASDAVWTTTAAAVSGIAAASTTPAPPDVTSSLSEPKDVAGGAIAGIVVGCLMAFRYWGSYSGIMASERGDINSTTPRLTTLWPTGAYGTDKEKAGYTVGGLQGIASPAHEMHASRPPLPSYTQASAGSLPASCPQGK